MNKIFNSDTYDKGIQTICDSILYNKILSMRNNIGKLYGFNRKNIN